MAVGKLRITKSPVANVVAVLIDTVPVVDPDAKTTVPKVVLVVPDLFMRLKVVNAFGAVIARATAFMLPDGIVNARLATNIAALPAAVTPVYPRPISYGTTVQAPSPRR